MPVVYLAEVIGNFRAFYMAAGSKLIAVIPAITICNELEYTHFI
jgi:hypothetical protein